MPRLKGPDKAQIRLRVHRRLAVLVTALGSQWLEAALEAQLAAGATPAGGAKPNVVVSQEKNSPKPAAEVVRSSGPAIGPVRPAPGSRLKKAKGS